MLLIRNKMRIFAESFTRMKHKILERLGYSDRIERMFGRGVIVALTGQRRVGKSCVMRRVRDRVAENPGNHVIYNVVSMDRVYAQTNIDGIRHIHLRDFLKKTIL